MQPSSWCARTVRTHVGLTQAARVDKFTRATVAVREVQSLSQNGHSRMLIDQSSPCIGSARLRTAWHHAAKLVACQDRAYSCRTHAGCKGGQIHSCHGGGGRGAVAGPERSLGSQKKCIRLNLRLFWTLRSSASIDQKHKKSPKSLSKLKFFLRGRAMAGARGAPRALY